MATTPPRVLRLDAGTAPRRLLVFLHGIGATADDLHPLASALAASLPEADMLLPDGLHAAPGGRGRQWWSVLGMTDADRPRRIRTAADEIEGWIEAELAARGLGPERLVLIGFSQGAALAAHLGSRRPIGGVVSLCGRAGDGGSEPIATPFLLINGALDPLAPPAQAAAFAESLRARGAPVTAHLHPRLGHGLDAEAVEEARAFLRSLVP